MDYPNSLKKVTLTLFQIIFTRDSKVKSDTFNGYQVSVCVYCNQLKKIKHFSHNEKKLNKICDKCLISRVEQEIKNLEESLLSYLPEK